MKQKYFVYSSIFILAVAFGCGSSAYASQTCDELSEQVHNGSLVREFFANLQKLIDTNNFCAKNLLGRLYAEGKHLPLDTVRAKHIFFDLASNGHPQSAFNLALLLSGEADSDPETILKLLLVVYEQTAGDISVGHLANISIELGRRYLTQLKKSNLTSTTDPKQLQSFFEIRLRQLNQEKALGVLANSKATKERWDSIAKAIFGVAAATHLIGTVGTVGKSSVGSSSCTYFRCDPFLSTGDLYNLGILSVKNDT